MITGMEWTIRKTKALMFERPASNVDAHCAALTLFIQVCDLEKRQSPMDPPPAKSSSTIMKGVHGKCQKLVPPN